MDNSRTSGRQHSLQQRVRGLPSWNTRKIWFYLSALVMQKTDTFRNKTDALTSSFMADNWWHSGYLYTFYHLDSFNLFPLVCQEEKCMHTVSKHGYMEGKQQLLLLLKGRLADIFEQDQYRCLQIYQYLIDYDICWCIPGFQHDIILKLIIYRLHLL